MFHLTLAARYLQGRKLRTFLTTLAIVFGVTIMFGLNGVLPTFAQAIRQNMLAAAGQVDLAVTGKTAGPFDATLVEEVRQVEGIAFASGSLRHNTILPAGSAIPALTVAGVETETAADVHAFNLASGRFLEAGDGNAILVSENVVEQMDLALGDSLTLPSATGAADFEIVGILSAPALPGVEEVYVPLAAAQSLFNQTGQINTIEAVFVPGRDQATIESAVEERLGSNFRLGQREAGQELLANLRVGETLLNTFAFLSLVMGGFIIFNTFRTVVAERRRDIALLRAVGASRRTILGLVITESLLQGIVGTLSGLLLGYGLMLLMVYAFRSIAEDLLRFQIGDPVITPAVLIVSVGLGVGVTLFAGLSPALAATRVPPLEAMRPATAEVEERKIGRATIVGSVLLVLSAIALFSGNFGLAALGSLLFLVGLVMVAPALIKPIARLFSSLLTLAFAREGQIAEGNLARQPGRAAITASAVMIGLAILIALTGMMTSVTKSFSLYLDKSLGADFLFMPQSIVLGSGNVGAGPELADTIRQTPGVGEVASLRIATSNADSVPLQVVGIDPETYPQVAGLEFTEGDETTAYQAMTAGRAIIANGLFVAQTGVKVGDSVTLQTAEGEQVYQVVGIGMDYLNAKIVSVYISQADLAQDFHQTNDILLMADTAEGADRAAVQSALEGVAEQYPAFSLFDSAVWRQEQITLLEGFTIGFYFILTALALPSLIALVNTLAIGVVERTREIGMLRAVGSTKRQIRRMILAESLLLSATGIAFGILGGLFLGYVMVQGMTFAGYETPYDFPLAGLLAATAIGLLFGVIASILPARRAAGLEIVTALRYE
jgi:putative ABC transport system permease protein